MVSNASYSSTSRCSRITPVYKGGGGDNGDSEGVKGQCDNCWIEGAIEGITGGDNGDSGEGVRGHCDNCWIEGAIEGITGGDITLLILPAVSRSSSLVKRENWVRKEVERVAASGCHKTSGEKERGK